MSEVESNKQLVQELFAAWSAHDADRAAACIGAVCNGGGTDGFRREFVGFLAAIPDITVDIEDLIAEGDRVASRVTMRGTHSGPLGGIPATGRPVVLKANHLFRCENGQIVQRHGQMDRLELMQQIGMKIVPA